MVDRRALGAVGRLGRPLQARWVLTLYPDAGEAGGSFLTAPVRRRGQRGVRGAAADPERARQESARRARAKVRRYCAANGLNRMGTLTYGGLGVHDPQIVRDHVGEFFRQLRRDLGGDPLPYLWVAEWHKSDHGLHVHFAVGRFVKQSLIASTWGHGFVSIKRLNDMPVGSTKRDEARRAAGYLAKYVAKDFDPSVGGLHRYEVAQGFQPKACRFEGGSLDDVLGRACEQMGAQPHDSWSSLDVEGWDRPPAVSYRWA